MGGGGGFASGLLAGSAMNRHEDRGQWGWAVIIFIIFAIIGLIFLAFMHKGEKRAVSDGGIGGILAATIAAKGVGNDHDRGYHELYEKLDNNEVKSGIAGIKSEVGALGLYLSKNASEYEMKNLEQFGCLKEQIGVLNMGMTQVLQKQNNADIINGVIHQLYGSPMLAKC